MRSNDRVSLELHLEQQTRRFVQHSLQLVKQTKSLALFGHDGQIETEWCAWPRISGPVISFSLSRSCGMLVEFNSGDVSCLSQSRT